MLSELGGGFEEILLRDEIQKAVRAHKWGNPGKDRRDLLAISGRKGSAKTTTLLITLEEACKPE